MLFKDELIDALAVWIADGICDPIKDSSRHTELFEIIVKRIKTWPHLSSR